MGENRPGGGVGRAGLASRSTRLGVAVSGQHASAGLWRRNARQSMHGHEAVLPLPLPTPCRVYKGYLQPEPEAAPQAVDATQPAGDGSPSGPSAAAHAIARALVSKSGAPPPLPVAVKVSLSGLLHMGWGHSCLPSMQLPRLVSPDSMVGGLRDRLQSKPGITVPPDSTRAARAPPACSVPALPTCALPNPLPNSLSNSLPN